MAQTRTAQPHTPSASMPDSHVHKRRLGRNIFVGVVLFAFVALIFAVTMVKLQATIAAGGVS